MVKVQVICVTYNQAPYIKEALNGFLLQKTDFDFEVLVADDCSTDGTSDIVADYARRHPGRITHIMRSENMGALANFMSVCEYATAPYVAICDGDDYWIDENKLQRQVDILDKYPDVNVCAHRTHISATPEWALYDYYKKQDFLQPKQCQYGVKLHLRDIIRELPHTSSFLFRWTVRRFPDWMKSDGIIGDSTVFYLQLGKGSLYVLGSVMSVYRRGANGVFDNNVSMDDMFLKTRLEYIKIMVNSIEYFKLHYDGFQIEAFEGRMWQEIRNLLDAVLRTGSWDKMLELKEKYPEAYEKAKSLLSEYAFRIKAINVLGRDGADLLFRDRLFLQTLKIPVARALRAKKKLRKWIPWVKHICGWMVYWLGALVPKDKRLWVFSGFKKKSYLDNTKYFFEHICQKHPEIRAVWLSKDNSVLKTIHNAGLRSVQMASFRGVWTMLRAGIAVTDHFRCSDFSPCLGYNARTRLVNLWHGAGLKNMVPEGDKIPNTDIPGVRLSSDIIPAENDSSVRKLTKYVKYFFRAPFRELFERYFLIVCANEPFVQNWAKPMHCSDEAILRCGYPRNEIFFRKKEPRRDGCRKIIYAPTYRMNADFEREMLRSFLVAAPVIGKMLNEKNASFVLRLHPHTWRNYSKQINDVIRDIPRITVSKNLDAYQELADYDIMIGDYSSIVQDYMISGCPVVLLAADKERFLANDCGFCMPYEESMPGPVVDSWEKAIEETSRLLDDPTLYADVRERVSKIFGMENFECEHASEKIVAEIKKRLSL